MASFVDPQNGDLAIAEHVAQLVEDFQGLRNVPISLTGINDAASYALTLKNAGTNSRGLIVYAADGTTVLLQVDGSGVLASAGGGPAGGIVTNTPGSISNAQLGPDVARANMMVNGSFDVWQRGSGPYTTAGPFGADRWQLWLGGGTVSASRDTANTDASLACCALVVAGAVAVGNPAQIYQSPVPLTDGDVFRGRTVSLSMRVKCSVATAFRIAAQPSVGTPGTSSYHTGGGAYETLTCTATVAANATGQVLTVTTLMEKPGTFYVDNAMLVVGSQAANYVPLQPADELARCQRYYELVGTIGSNVIVLMGGATSTTNAFAPWRFNTVKAVVPTLTVSSPAHFGIFNAAGAPLIATALAGTGNVYGAHLQVTVASGLVGGNAGVIQSQSGSSSIVAESNP